MPASTHCPAAVHVALHLRERQVVDVVCRRVLDGVAPMQRLRCLISANAKRHGRGVHIGDKRASRACPARLEAASRAPQQSALVAALWQATVAPRLADCRLQGLNQTQRNGRHATGLQLARTVAAPAMLPLGAPNEPVRLVFNDVDAAPWLRHLRRRGEGAALAERRPAPGDTRRLQPDRQRRWGATSAAAGRWRCWRAGARAGGLRARPPAASRAGGLRAGAHARARGRPCRTRSPGWCGCGGAFAGPDEPLAPPSAACWQCPLSAAQRRRSFARHAAWAPQVCQAPAPRASRAPAWCPPSLSTDV